MTLAGLKLLLGLGLIIDSARKGRQLDTVEVRGRGRGLGRAQRINVGNLDDRVSKIRDKVFESMRDGDLIKKARQIVNKKCGNDFCVRENDSLGELTAIVAALKRRYRYVADPTGVDAFATVNYIEDAGGGDCDEATALVCSYMGAIGYHCGARVIQTMDSDSWNHIYALVGIPRDRPTKWVPVDLSVRGAKVGWEPTDVRRRKDYRIVPR